jgi:predicted transcriptional regulator
MKIKSLVETECPSVYVYASRSSATGLLKKHPYLMVLDEQDRFYGILTKHDLIISQHLLVADCIIHKDYVTEEDSLLEVLNLMINIGAEALPVKSEDKSFAGIISKNRLIEYLLKYSVHLENRLLSERKQ